MQDLDGRTMHCVKPGGRWSCCRSPRTHLSEPKSRSTVPRSKLEWARQMQRSSTSDTCCPSRACSRRLCCELIRNGRACTMIRASESSPSSSDANGVQNLALLVQKSDPREQDLRMHVEERHPK